MGSTHDLNVRHNKAMAHMNLMNLYQDKFQDIHDFRDQYKTTYDSSQGTGFVIHKADGTSQVFVPYSRGYSSLMLRAILHMS